MDIVALKSNRKKRFTVQQFEKMNIAERDSYKGNIVCDECGGEAHYRRAAKDGKAACFCAKHGIGCDVASNVKRSNVEGDDETNEFEMSSDFEIAWNYVNMHSAFIGNQDDVIDSNIGKNKKRYTVTPSIEKKSKIEISTILKCAEFGILGEQDYFVNIPGDGLKLLKDVVVELGKIDDSYLNQNLFFWGKIHRFSNTWINTQYANDISIRVDDPIQENFWRIYKDKIMKLLHDKRCSIIIFGEAKKSVRSNYYIILKEMKYFYARKSRI